MIAKSEELIELIEKVDEHITTIAFVRAAWNIQNKRSHRVRAQLAYIDLECMSKLRIGANSEQEQT